MKAISLKQPWAWLIVKGIKDVENRTWLTHYRGLLLIHASKKFDYEGFNWIAEQHGIEMPKVQDFLRGYIVGKVDLIDCVDYYKSKWFFGPWGFVFEAPECWQVPIAYRGQLKLFEVPNKIFMDVPIS